MNAEQFSSALGKVNDKYIMEAVTYKRKKKSGWLKWGAVAACLCIVMIGAITIERYVSVSRGSMGIESISISEVKETGAAFTEYEIQNFLDESGDHIISQIAEKINAPTESISISNSGYYHVTVTENENILNLNYLTLPVIADEKIITSITLYRDAGEIKYEFDYGGTWGDEMTELLTLYPNEQFVMIYVGDFVEVAISSDNTIHFLTKKINDVFETGVDYYTAFKFEENTMDSSLLK